MEEDPKAPLLVRPVKRTRIVKTPGDRDTVKGDISLDKVLDDQLLTLARVTKQLLMRSSGEGFVTKDEIQSLATCIKVTMELKAKQNELFDNLSDEELEALARSQKGSGNSSEKTGT